MDQFEKRVTRIAPGSIPGSENMSPGCLQWEIEQILIRSGFDLSRPITHRGLDGGIVEYKQLLEEEHPLYGRAYV